MPELSSAAYEWRGDVNDEELEGLHAACFDHVATVRRWSAQLHAHSLGWVTARHEGRLLGFVNVAWDGASHAFLVDTAVAPDTRLHGIGQELVRRAAGGARAAGCAWLHVDFEPDYLHFYIDRCGLHRTEAGLLALS
jgi:GNAT superfamily N-acetyltransferase